MTGPKSAASPVPRDCTRNSEEQERQRVGMAKGAKPGEATSSPSTADSTEIAGVMMPSPKRRGAEQCRQA